MKFFPRQFYDFIRTTFYKGTSGVLLVFDFSRSATWDSIQDWRSKVKQFAGDIPFILIGNKKDLVPEVGEVIDTDEARRYAEQENSIYIETSVKDGTNVEEAFLELTKLIIARSEGKS